jgi:UDP-GlcNAc:undecaprenyl-phosphate GlcNAc-1-phosphate transferase
MGDSGSLFLGFSVAVVAILLTQNPQYPVEPTFPVLVLLLPIFDTLRVMFLRIFSMRNPFKADKTHLHHLIVRRNFRASKTVTFLWMLTAFFGILALLMINNTSTPYMIVGLCSSLLLSIFADALTRRR